MSARTFAWYLLVLLAGSLVLVWTVVSLAAMVYAASLSEGGAMVLYAAFAAAGLGALIGGGLLWRHLTRRDGQ